MVTIFVFEVPQSRIDLSVNLPIETLFFVGYPAILALRAKKGQTLLPNLLLICHVPRLMYPMTLYTILTNIFFPLQGGWQSSYRRCRKVEVVLCRARIGHTHLTHSYILRKDLLPQCGQNSFGGIIQIPPNTHIIIFKRVLSLS